MGIEKSVDKILKVVTFTRAILTLGIIIPIISVAVKYEIGFKVGLITLVAGGIFKNLEILEKHIFGANTIKTNFRNGIIINIIRRGSWIILLIFYAYFLDNIIDIIKFF